MEEAERAVGITAIINKKRKKMSSKYKEVDGYLVDENNNSVYIELYTLEKAIEMLDSLKNCKDCINCLSCENCVDCSSCNYCQDCNSCRGCLNCSDCDDCDDCSSCISCNCCSNLDECEGEIDKCEMEA